MNHEKMAGRTQLSARSKRRWRSHRQYHHCRRYGRRGAEDVYLAYAQADRRERYIMEEQSSGKLLSLEQMEEDALLPDYVGAETAPSAETEALEREELRNLAEQKQILLLALLSLKDTDRELINALFFDGASTREYAQRMGVSQRAVIKRRDRILRDLKKFFENSSK
jgi:RNA polymerase sigma factor (sigma-70 family)